jgi:hypothetical protein
VHGVSLFINLAIFQLAGLRHKSNTAVGKWKASSCEPPRQTVRRPSRTAAAYRSKPYQALNPSQFDTIRQGNPELIFGWRAQRPKAISRVTFVLCAPLQSAYHRYMRHFNTKQVAGGGTRFNCVHCPYSVQRQHAGLRHSQWQPSDAGCRCHQPAQRLGARLKPLLLQTYCFGDALLNQSTIDAIL